MLCANCGTEYDVTPVENGKSKFCRNCGNFLYKSENGTVIFNKGNSPVISPFDLQKKVEIDTEKQKQEQLLKQRQLEQEQQRQAETERSKQEEILRQRQYEIQRQQEIEAEKQKQEQQKQAEAERIKQEEIIRKRQQEVESEKIRQEELLRQRQQEIQRQKEQEAEQLRLAEIEQQKQLEQQKLQSLEFAKQQQVALQKQLEFERQEKEQLEKDYKERELKLQKEYDLVLQREKEKEQNRQSNLESEQPIQETEKSSSAWKYILIAVIALGLGAGGYYLIDRFVLNQSSPTEAISPNTTPAEESPSISEEKIKNDLLGKEIIGWGKIEPAHITSIKSDIQKRNDTLICVSTLDLTDNVVKSKAEITLNYLDTLLLNVGTNKITFWNTAPANAWYSFETIPNCTISVNTNNNPIQLKTCQNCDILKINTSIDSPQKISNHPKKIYITSDTPSEAAIEFTYTPEK